MGLREIVWDTETTGISPKEGHKLVEIGAIEVVDKMPTGNHYHQFINPEREIEKEAIRVHGITNERVANEPIFDNCIDGFLKFIGDSPLVAHNASFDMGFVNYQLEAIGRPVLSNPVVDTLKIAKKKFPGARATLDALCNRFDVDLSVRTLHGALLDSELLAEVYLNLCGGLQHGLTLDSGKKEEVKVLAMNELQGELRKARQFDMNQEDFDAHKSFLKENIKNSLWFEKPENS